MGTFADMKIMNGSKNKARLQEAINTYNDYMNLAFNYQQCLHPRDLTDEHEKAECRALQAFQPGRSCSEGFDLGDEDHRMLSQSLGRRYEELRGINDTNNREAIQLALEAFKAYLEDRLSFSWWWLLVVPMIQTAVNKNKYIEEARQAALLAFRAKRRPGNYFSGDRYLDELESEMTRMYGS